MGQRDCSLISAVACIQKGRNEREDLERDPVYRGEPIPLGSGQTDDLKSVPLENVDLKGATCESLPYVSLVRWPNLRLVESSTCSATNMNFSHLTWGILTPPDALCTRIYAL